MFPRAFFGVLALALMLTVTLVSPTCAITKAFVVDFDTNDYLFNTGTEEISGRFTAIFDPTVVAFSGASVSFTAISDPIKTPETNGIFRYDPSGPGELTLLVNFISTAIEPEGTFILVTSGYGNFTPTADFVSARLEPLGAMAHQGSARLVNVLTGPPQVPLPAGFFLVGTGLLGLAGWRRLRKS